ncbi:MAG: alpha/beta hydrolase-fold protein [Chloroflexota bacterium]
MKKNWDKTSSSLRSQKTFAESNFKRFVFVDVNRRDSKMKRPFLWLLFGTMCLLWGTGCFPSALIAQNNGPLPTLIPSFTPAVSSSEIGSTPTLDSVVDVPPTFTPQGVVLPSATPIPTEVPTNTATAVPLSPTPVTPEPTVPQVTVAAKAPLIEAVPARLGCDENGRLFKSQFPSDVGGPLRDYHIYLPPCYGMDGRTYPVLYLFHGSIQTDSHWADLGLANILNDKMGSGEYPPFVVVMPNNGSIGNTTSGNDHSIEGVTVNALMPYIESITCTWNDAEGRSLGGISRGGYWALMIAFRHTDLFTAVSGHSSHLRFETDDPVYNPLATYETADLSNMRIWMDWGETDFLRTGQRQLARSLHEINANLTDAVNDGGHNERYWLTHLPSYLDWHAAEWSTDRADYPECDI